MNGSILGIASNVIPVKNAKKSGEWFVSHFGFNIRNNDQEGVVTQHLHDQIQKGDKLLFSAPAGDFVLSTDEFPVVFISGGIGITPLLSMLNDVV